MACGAVSKFSEEATSSLGPGAETDIGCADDSNCTCSSASDQIAWIDSAGKDVPIVRVQGNSYHDLDFLDSDGVLWSWNWSRGVYTAQGFFLSYLTGDCTGPAYFEADRPYRAILAWGAPDPSFAGIYAHSPDISQTQGVIASHWDASNNPQQPCQTDSGNSSSALVALTDAKKLTVPPAPGTPPYHPVWR